MIDLPVKLIPHPIGHPACVKECCGFADHVIEIDQPTLPFALGIASRIRLADKQRLRKPVSIIGKFDLVHNSVGPRKQL